MKKRSFSHTLLIQESALIWVITVGFIVLAYIAILNGYAGSLPWLAALPSVAWGAYAVSQAMYYNKSKNENTQGGVVFETAMIAAARDAELSAGDNFEMPENPIGPADEDPDPFGPM